jgi:hypothetical protein
MAPPRSTPRSSLNRTAAPAVIPASKRQRGTATQPIEVSDTQVSLPTHLSPRKALAASQAAIEDSLSPTFESQLRDALGEAVIIAPVEGSKAATVETTKAVEEEEELNNSFGRNFADNLEGIDSLRLKRFCEPTATAGPRSSWIFRHGYRVARRSDMTQIWFICRWCHHIRG